MIIIAIFVCRTFGASLEVLLQVLSPHLCGRAGRGDRSGAGSVLQGEVCDEHDQFGKSSAHLRTRTLQQVLREARGDGKEDAVCKPAADILAVTQ